MAAMTTHMKRKSLSATAGVTVLLGALLAGCSGGADVEAFCTDAATVQDGKFLDDIDYTDSDAVKVATDAALEQINAIEAPKEIAGDWKVLTDVMDTFLTGVQGVDLTSEDAMDEMGKLTELMTSDEVTKAGDNIDTFISENCEA